MLNSLHVTTSLLKAELSFDFLPLLFSLQLLPELLNLLSCAFLALLALSLLIHDPALHDPGHNFCSVDVLEFVIGYLAVDVQILGDGVGIVGEWHEGSDAMVHKWERVGGGGIVRVIVGHSQ